jgi:hypothetical protein
MFKLVGYATLALAPLSSLAACQRLETKKAEPINLHETMKAVVAPDAQIVWDFSNLAIDDAGQPSDAKLTPANWDGFQRASARLLTAANHLAVSEGTVVARRGEKIQDEGTPGAWGASEVQKAIDANPEHFRRHARALAQTASQFVVAGKAHDVVKVAALADTLDQACEACHKQFWYPDNVH